MYDLAGENELDLEALRARLRRMSEKELLRFGQAARYMCPRWLTTVENRGEPSSSS
jgi:hypothetical protein